MKLSEKIRLLSESDLSLWKRQMENKSTEELMNKVYEIRRKINEYNSNKVSLEDKEFDELLSKLDYLESRLGIESKFGRELR